MSRIRNKTTKITRLDESFFRYLHEVKIATATQINNEVYKYPVKHVLYKRLRKFERLKLICGVYHESIYPRKIYRLTKDGFKKYVSTNTEHRIQLGSDSVTHDLELGDIRHKFLSEGFTENYFTENSLRTWVDLKTSPHLFPYLQAGCDGVAEITVGDTMVRFAIEYEASIKHWHRYDDILARYYAATGISFVIYICASKKILWDLKCKDRGQFKDRQAKIFYISLEEFMNSNPIVITNRDDKILKIHPKPAGSDLGQSEVTGDTL